FDGGAAGSGIARASVFCGHVVSTGTCRAQRSVTAAGQCVDRSVREADIMMARTPEPPYYAVIFTSRRTDGDQGYAETAERMAELAREQPGFLGVESARGEDGLG